MFKMKKITLMLSLILSVSFSFKSFANLGRAAETLKKTRGLKRTEKVSIELISEGYYFTAIPWVKEYLTKNRGRVSTSMEKGIDKIINIVGTRQFELIPIKYLRRSQSNSVRYLIAKKYLRKNQASKALQYTSKINANHPVYPYALNLRAVALSLQGKSKSAIDTFRDCANFSAARVSKAKNEFEKRRLLMNTDYCIMGEARALFQAKSYLKANLRYLDIPKSSAVWPEVLFEEAWNSYYLKNYNRTLGKLVTYKAPVFDYIFNPEIDVLNALTFLKMCLYKDAKKASDSFNSKYMNDARNLRLYLKNRSRKYKYFYRLMTNFEKNGRATSVLLVTLLKSISREPSYKENKRSLILAAKELEKLSRERNSLMKRIAKKNLSDVIRTQRDLVGSYVRERLVQKYGELYKAFEGMSYIKLETLAQRKAKLYNFDDKKGKRGDIKYIERNDKQYFWNFNGEFWADELGDYVFALGSEC
jgi:hypothetical protein